jgi:hypothetical protein
MLKIINPVLLAILLLPSLVLAHGPSRQKVVKEIEINAPVDKVWAIISDYCSIKDWNPGVTACESDKGNATDSIRTITLESGQQMKEKLVKYKPDATMYQYMLMEPNIDAMPINTHGATLSVKAAGSNKAIVEWKGAFYRSFPGPNPPPELSDETANKVLSDFYTSGLENIKTMAEK